MEPNNQQSLKTLKFHVKYDKFDFECMLSQISEDEFQIYAKEQCSCYYYMDKFSLSSLQMLNTNFHDYRNLNDFFSSLEAFNKKGKLQISESPTSNNASSYLILYYSYEAFIPSTEVKITK